MPAAPSSRDLFVQLCQRDQAAATPPVSALLRSAEQVGSEDTVLSIFQRDFRGRGVGMKR